MVSKEQWFRKLIGGPERGPWRGLLRLILSGLTLPYGIGIWLRNQAFDRGWKRVVSVGVPVISVGNLTTGGTGKTPIVAMVVQSFQRFGRTPGIVSRGYGSDGTGVNDEKRVLDLLCPRVPHLQHPDRIRSSRQLIEEQGVNVIVMDDGFQHRRLARQLDIVLIDASNPFGFGSLLPRGLLREPRSSLGRAHLVLLTRCDLVAAETVAEIEIGILSIAPQLQGRVFATSFQPGELRNVDGTIRPLSDLRGATCTLMSGIGNPEAFAATCQSAGLRVVSQQNYPDHHHYHIADLQNVRQLASRDGSTVIITTLKDLVKLPADVTDFWALNIQTTFHREDQFRRFQEILNEVATSK